jgi:hypothetical protein
MMENAKGRYYPVKSVNRAKVAVYGPDDQVFLRELGLQPIS